MQRLSYYEGRGTYFMLYNRVESFLRMTFSDAEEKLRELNFFLSTKIEPYQSREEEDRRKNVEYQDNLQKLRRSLAGYKGEINSALEPSRV